MSIEAKINLFKPIALICAVASLYTGASAQTMDAFIQQASEHAMWLDGKIRARFAEVASTELHQTLNAIDFIVNRDTAIPTAYAERLPNAQQRIVMSAQLVLVFYYTAELNFLNLATANRWEQCSLAYSSYLRISYGRILEDSLAGRMSSLLQPPEDYARQFRGHCTGLEDSYPFPEELMQRRAKSVSAAIATVYLHELAHHVYGDANELTEPLDLSDIQNMQLFLRSMCHSRQKELRADKWAARALVELGWGSEIFDMTMWGALTSLGDMDPDIERGTTHPSPSRRMGRFLDEGRTFLKARGVELKPELSKQVDRAILLQQKIELLLPVTQIAGAEGVSCH